MKHIRYFLGDGQRTACLCVHEDPIRFAFDQHLLVGFAHELVLAQRTHAADVFDPGADLDLLALESGQQIFDLVFAHHPGRIGTLGLDAANRGVMLDGDVLHPLHVGDVVDVPVLVDGRGGNLNGPGVHGGDGHGPDCTEDLNRRCAEVAGFFETLCALRAFAM